MVREETLVLRITQLWRTPRQEALKIEGWIGAEEVPTLAEVGEAVRQRGAILVLDLSAVQSIDEEGFVLLQRWRGPRLDLRGCNRFLRILLREHGLSCEEVEAAKKPPGPTHPEEE